MLYGTIITFPADFASSTLSITNSAATDFVPLLTLVIGLILAVLAVVLLIRVFTHH